LCDELLSSAVATDAIAAPRLPFGGGGGGDEHGAVRAMFIAPIVTEPA